MKRITDLLEDIKKDPGTRHDCGSFSTTKIMSLAERPSNNVTLFSHFECDMPVV